MSEAADALLDAVAIDATTAATTLAARDLMSLRVKVIAVCQSRLAACIEAGKIQEAIAIIDATKPFAPSASEWFVQALTLDRLRKLSPEILKSLPPATLAAAVAALPPTAEIKLPSLVNSIGMEMKLLHAGTFVMGAAQDQGDDVRHAVTLTRRFYLGVHEVTNAQWRRVMGQVPSKWTDDDLPVEQVTWIEAVEFCEKLSALPEERMLGRVYRLPTEAEWEFACRAGTTARRSFGDDRSKDLDKHAWCAENAGGRTHPVGQKLPNPFGFFDMYGNVWEWCSDWYGDLAGGRVTDPEGPALGALRVYRGGSWGSNADRCQSSNRDGYDPTHRQSHLGFRVALDFRQPVESELAE
jgi:formylglycine-generating enzyme required for sulfatase activity